MREYTAQYSGREPHIYRAALLYPCVVFRIQWHFDIFSSSDYSSPMCFNRGYEYLESADLLCQRARVQAWRLLGSAASDQ